MDLLAQAIRRVFDEQVLNRKKDDLDAIEQVPAEKQTAFLQSDRPLPVD